MTVTVVESKKRLPTPIRKMLETVAAHVSAVAGDPDYTDKISSDAISPDARIYLESWVLRYLREVFEWDDGRITPGKTSGARYSEQMEEYPKSSGAILDSLLCKDHPDADLHDHCPRCGEARQEYDIHECPPGFKPKAEAVE